MSGSNSPTACAFRHCAQRAMRARLSDAVSPSTLPPALLAAPQSWCPVALQSFVNAIRTGRARDIEALLKVGAVDGTSGMPSKTSRTASTSHFLQEECTAERVRSMCSCRNRRGGEALVKCCP